MQLQSLFTLLLAAAAAAQDVSAPSVGQKNRYRLFHKFDISIELHGADEKVVPDLSNLSITINGKKVKDVIVDAPAAPYLFNYTSTTMRTSNPSSPTSHPSTSGEYVVEVTAGKEKVNAKWVVRGSSTRKAKNALLFIGDGMAPSMISAARYISRNTKFGKFKNGDGFLDIEKFDGAGKIATNGLDSIITDSANSAAAYSSGHKGWVNTLNVYADTSKNDQLDDAKVEAITEIIRRVRPGMCIGVVTTASVADATPAAFFAHTRARGQADIIIDQALNGFKHYVPVQGEPMPWGPAVKPDVLLGGGGSAFKGKKALNSTDYYAAYAAAGYTVVNTKTDLTKAPVNGSPLLGIFHSSHMDTWLEREVNKEGLKQNKASSPLLDGTTALDQPGLEQMTLKAIEVMEKKCTDGWFLMSEAASVDKAMHPMDFDRALADLLELDRTVKAVRNLPSAKDTAIFLTADHSQGYDVYGTVDTAFFRAASNDDKTSIDGQPNKPNDGTYHVEQRNSIGIYEDAGWIDNVLDAKGLPTKFADAVDVPNFVENYEYKTTGLKGAPLTRSAVADMNITGLLGTQIYRSLSQQDNAVVPSAADSNGFVGIPRTGNLPVTSGSTVHTLNAVDLYCWGPNANKCTAAHDNTELFFLLADTLGLGDKPDAPSATVVTVTVTAGAYGAPTGYAAPAGNAPYVAPVGTGKGVPATNLYSSAAAAGVSAIVALAAMAFF
ncbi:alkaline phosphatase-like protein [Rhizoclosmatium globosum]|uniref:alkaline phosphatase n=1 Tax=Rhizoclosmatium globosum TaxID=329046 RepID=A0A1Y2CW38_9FUNG|nr:alkaline phosphatase-like protein [Rhizoclosmatium globosum]|eukprot:ORY51242.1 alkaline phosphatase-like protein [Rhizoclosmatium globosum]